MIKLPCVLLQLDTSVPKWRQHHGLLFCYFAFFFSFKCHRSGQVMCECNTNVQSSNSLRLGIVSAKSKITLLDEVIYHQVILSFWNKRMLYYSSTSQILADFGDYLLKFKQSSNRPVYFRVSPVCFFGVRDKWHDDLKRLFSFVFTIEVT